MYGMQIDSIKLALKRYRTAYLAAEQQKKHATDNYRVNIIAGVRANIERELQQEANKQAEAVHKAAAEVVQQIGTEYRMKGADLNGDYQLLQNDAFDLDEKDLESMIERNKSNPTMIRAIRGYLKQHCMALPTPPTEKDKLDAMRRIEVDVAGVIDGTINSGTGGRLYIGQLDKMVDDFDSVFSAQLATLNGEYIDAPKPQQMDADPHEYELKNAAYGVMESAKPDFWDTHKALY